MQYFFRFVNYYVWNKEKKTCEYSNPMERTTFNKFALERLKELIQKDVKTATLADVENGQVLLDNIIDYNNTQANEQQNKQTKKIISDEELQAADLADFGEKRQELISVEDLQALETKFADWSEKVWFQRHCTDRDENRIVQIHLNMNGHIDLVKNECGDYVVPLEPISDIKREELNQNLISRFATFDEDFVNNLLAIRDKFRSQDFIIHYGRRIAFANGANVWLARPDSLKAEILKTNAKLQQPPT
jgi:hypothetical protein